MPNEGSAASSGHAFQASKAFFRQRIGGETQGGVVGPPPTAPTNPASTFRVRPTEDPTRQAVTACEARTIPCSTQPSNTTAVWRASDVPRNARNTTK